MPKVKPIMTRVKDNALSSLDALDNLKRNDPNVPKANMIEALLKKILAIVDGKELPPDPAEFVCKFEDTCRFEVPLTPDDGGAAGAAPQHEAIPGWAVREHREIMEQAEESRDMPF